MASDTARPAAWTRPVTALVLAITLLATACARGVGDHPAPASPAPGGATGEAATDPEGLPADIPSESRISDGGGEPRDPEYWVAWSTCGEDSQADVAEANGGREAGWILLDDLIEDPGLVVGDLEVRTCGQGVAVLQARGRAAPPGDPAYALAAQVLAAEANLTVGAESCTAAEGALAIGGSALASLGFDGSGGYLSADSPEAAAVEETTTVLAAYNAGTLCR